jgi:membrane fusion protein (multidrug efflux system)
MTYRYSKRYAWVPLLGLAAFGSQPLYGKTMPKKHHNPMVTGHTHEVRGLIESKEKATLSSQIDGRIIKIPFIEGSAFNKDDVLVAFDCRSYAAQLKRASAKRSGAFSNLSSKRKLAKLSSVSQLEVDLANAEYLEADATVEATKIDVDRCTIKAPFDGKIAATEVNIYESVAAGSPLLNILNDQILNIHLLVPSKWLSKLSVGSKFKIRVDETGKTYGATVDSIGAEVDEVSQSISLKGKITDQPKELMSGMSGMAVFNFKK